MPKVSVIMPVYNGIKFLGRAIRSILAQTEMDFEFIIFDDGSTESVHDCVHFYGADKRIRAYCSAKNRGLSHRLNQCLEHAQGDYIMRMDGDDVSHPYRIEKQLELFTEGVGLVGCWGSSVDENGKPIQHFVDVNCRCSDEDLIKVYPTKLCMIDASSMYSREAIEKTGLFDPRALTAETYNYNLRVLKNFKGRVVQEILYQRTVWSGSSPRSQVDTLSLARRLADETSTMDK